MGVRGLSTFIDNNQKLLRVEKLHNTKVVIDGNNLYHFLYYQYHILHQYGGDYDHFSRKCKRFFSLLGKCGVEPIIVFDGGYGPDDRKLPTVLSRMRDRLNTAESVCRTGHGKIIPILAIETFRLVLVELNIPHVACDFEADDDIAALANELNCPVMSNDSDFFVYDLKAGYIPLDYINLTLCVYNTETAAECICTKDKILKSSEYRYLPVKFYHRDRLADLFTNKSTFIIPLFATFLGNDYLSTATLAEFYAKLKTAKVSTKYNFSPKSQDRLGSLMQWLNDNQDTNLDTFVNFVFDNIGNKEEDIKAEIYRSIQSYMTTGQYTSYSLKAFLDKRNREMDMPSNSRQPITDYFDNDLPLWFVEKLRQCEIHPHVQNAIVLHRVILPCQVEIISNASTYQCSRAIREVTYGILFQSDAHKMDVLSQDNCVLEYDRDQKNIKKVYVAPAAVAFNSQLPSLSGLPDLPTQERQLFLLCTLGLSKEVFESHKSMDFDDDLVLLIALMSYWINHSVPKVSSAHLDSLILGVIILHVKVLKWIEERKLIGLDYVEPDLYKQLSQAFYSSSDKHINRVEMNVEKYCEKPHHSSKSPADFNIVHGFTQFQACLRDVINLNQLLLCPFTQINPAFILNCSLLYNLCSEIIIRSNPELFILELLDRGSPLCQSYLTVRTQVLQYCNGDCFTEHQEKLIKKKSKAKKKSSKQTEVSVKNDSVEAEDVEKKPKLVANCSVTNRFSLLDLDD